MNIVPEGGMAYFWNLNQIFDGHTTIEHSIPMAPLYNGTTPHPKPNPKTPKIQTPKPISP